MDHRNSTIVGRFDGQRFATGYGASGLDERFAGAPALSEPVDSTTLEPGAD